MLEHLEFDAPTVPGKAGEPPDLGAAGELVDHALEVHERI
jgi:hypothetical protein